MTTFKTEVDVLRLDKIDPEAGNAAVTKLLENTQGNILKSNGRNYHCHLLIKFKPDAAKAKNWLRNTVAPKIMSAADQWKDTALYTRSKQGPNNTETAAEKALRRKGATFTTVLLSAAGYRHLGYREEQLPDDKSFRLGADNANVIQKLADVPVDEWHPGFQGVHALLIIAGDQDELVFAEAEKFRESLDGVGEVTGFENGNALRVDRQGQPVAGGPPREHFGFLDGVSDPLFFKNEVDKATKGGADKFDPSAQLGLALVEDPLASGGYGSYIVFRKLEQDVAKFRLDRDRLGKKLATAAGAIAEPLNQEFRDLADAYIMGRFPDGAPVALRDSEDGISEENNFDYKNDSHGMKCPFAAHVRKTNPRGDTELLNRGITLEQERSRRIVRRGVTYGPHNLDPATGQKVGLLFICAQASIEKQFEFMQQAWSNAPDFPVKDVGIDPVIGQGPLTKQKWPKKYGDSDSGFTGLAIGDWVTLQGAAYFFAPSPLFLKNLR